IMANIPVIMRVLAASVRIADKSALLVREIMSSRDLGIVDKVCGGQKNLQTKADTAVEKLIRASLLAEFPQLNVIGEEDEKLDLTADAKAGSDDQVLRMACPPACANLSQEEIVVWVDPLDGTADNFPLYSPPPNLPPFISGLLDHVTILIGLAVNGEAVGGVINQPFYNYQSGPQANLGRTIWGLVGLGAFGWNRAEPPVGRRILITTRSHSNELVNLCLDSIYSPDLCPTPTKKTMTGTKGLALRVIEGEADAYVFASPGCKKWDTCAPEAILRAVGGNLTDVHGKKINYHKDVKFPNTGGVIATYRDHQTIIDLVPQKVRDNL
uniref:3'(2'),5'-bisphosphate nucleotidase 1 n=1 Tax=Ciona savignyi TaxID=51511 RepID=H2YKQ1_CIOSA